MRIICICFIFLLVFLFSSCLWYEEIIVRITFDDSFDVGTINVTYHGIVSSDSSLEKRNDDFNELLEMLEGDDFLLDMIEEGIYVKDRRLYEKDGVLIGSYSGIFRKLKIEGEELQQKEEERILQIDTEDNDRVESNGRIYQSEGTTFIVWPSDAKILEYSIKKSVGSTTYSLLDFYKKEFKY